MSVKLIALILILAFHLSNNKATVKPKVLKTTTTSPPNSSTNSSINSSKTLSSNKTETTHQKRYEIRKGPFFSPTVEDTVLQAALPLNLSSLECTKNGAVVHLPFQKAAIIIDRKVWYFKRNEHKLFKLTKLDKPIDVNETSEKFPHSITASLTPDFGSYYFFRKDRYCLKSLTKSGSSFSESMNSHVSGEEWEEIYEIDENGNKILLNRTSKEFSYTENSIDNYASTTEKPIENEDISGCIWRPTKELFGCRIKNPPKALQELCAKPFVTSSVGYENSVYIFTNEKLFVFDASIEEDKPLGSLTYSFDATQRWKEMIPMCGGIYTGGTQICVAYEAKRFRCWSSYGIASDVIGIDVEGGETTTTESDSLESGFEDDLHDDEVADGSSEEQGVITPYDYNDDEVSVINGEKICNVTIKENKLHRNGCRKLEEDPNNYPKNLISIIKGSDNYVHYFNKFGKFCKRIVKDNSECSEWVDNGEVFGCKSKNQSPTLKQLCNNTRISSGGNVGTNLCVFRRGKYWCFDGKQTKDKPFGELVEGSGKLAKDKWPGIHFPGAIRTYKKDLVMVYKNDWSRWRLDDGKPITIDGSIHKEVQVSDVRGGTAVVLPKNRVAIIYKDEVFFYKKVKDKIFKDSRDNGPKQVDKTKENFPPYITGAVTVDYTNYYFFRGNKYCKRPLIVHPNISKEFKFEDKSNCNWGDTKELFGCTEKEMSSDKKLANLCENTATIGIIVYDNQIYYFIANKLYIMKYSQLKNYNAFDDNDFFNFGEIVSDSVIPSQKWEEFDPKQGGFFAINNYMCQIIDYEKNVVDVHTMIIFENNQFYSCWHSSGKRNKKLVQLVEEPEYVTKPPELPNLNGEIKSFSTLDELGPLDSNDDKNKTDDIPDGNANEEGVFAPFEDENDCERVISNDKICKVTISDNENKLSRSACNSDHDENNYPANLVATMKCSDNYWYYFNKAGKCCKRIAKDNSECTEWIDNSEVFGCNSSDPSPALRQLCSNPMISSGGNIDTNACVFRRGKQWCFNCKSAKDKPIGGLVEGSGQLAKNKFPGIHFPGAVATCNKKYLVMVYKNEWSKWKLNGDPVVINAPIDKEVILSECKGGTSVLLPNNRIAYVNKDEVWYYKLVNGTIFKDSRDNGPKFNNKTMENFPNSISGSLTADYVNYYFFKDDKYCKRALNGTKSAKSCDWKDNRDLFGCAVENGANKDNKLNSLCKNPITIGTILFEDDIYFFMSDKLYTIKQNKLKNSGDSLNFSAIVFNKIKPAEKWEDFNPKYGGFFAVNNSYMCQINDCDKNEVSANTMITFEHNRFYDCWNSNGKFVKKHESLILEKKKDTSNNEDYYGNGRSPVSVLRIVGNNYVRIRGNEVMYLHKQNHWIPDRIIACADSEEKFPCNVSAVLGKLADDSYYFFKRRYHCKRTLTPTKCEYKSNFILFGCGSINNANNGANSVQSESNKIIDKSSHTEDDINLMAKRNVSQDVKLKANEAEVLKQTTIGQLLLESIQTQSFSRTTESVTESVTESITTDSATEHLTDGETVRVTEHLNGHETESVTEHDTQHIVTATTTKRVTDSETQSVTQNVIRSVTEPNTGHIDKSNHISKTVTNASTTKPSSIKHEKDHNSDHKLSKLSKLVKNAQIKADAEIKISISKKADKTTKKPTTEQPPNKTKTHKPEKFRKSYQSTTQKPKKKHLFAARKKRSVDANIDDLCAKPYVDAALIINEKHYIFSRGKYWVFNPKIPDSGALGALEYGPGNISKWKGMLVEHDGLFVSDFLIVMFLERKWWSWGFEGKVESVNRYWIEKEELKSEPLNGLDGQIKSFSALDGDDVESSPKTAVSNETSLKGNETEVCAESRENTRDSSCNPGFVEILRVRIPEKVFRAEMKNKRLSHSESWLDLISNVCEKSVGKPVRVRPSVR